MVRILVSVALVCIFYCRYGFAIYANVSSSRKIETNPAIWTEEDGIWGPLLEDWATQPKRTGRVLQIPLHQPTFVLEDKIDNASNDEKESKISPGKIVNGGTNYNNYKPKPSGRPISETDLYLLGAIEKLVYRTDFMEKRLRRVEEMLYFVMAGNRIDQQVEPCTANFTRVGPNCYLFSSVAGREYDWKAANKYCKKQGAVLAEMETIEENQDVIAFIQTNEYLRGKDFWTGGLNPGLLWIWSNSARPVTAPGSQNKKNPSANILGDGRCLRLAYDPSLRSYSYRGTDCSIRYSIICELPDNTTSNEIRRLGRNKKILDEF
ncbi:uncharacterized protein LOC109598351 [Aethina tumida]|uniref:uncharacterized protein LOC109598351 n=1 Tax=Aethina tumida TaxID=116153 RepID=UPI002147E619|nr:uncharacterized protein LOC109598351 [Aethina tumida]